MKKSQTITASKVLQFLSQLEALQVKLRTHNKLHELWLT